MVLSALLKQIKNFPAAGLINEKEFHILLLQTAVWTLRQQKIVC